MEVAAGVFVATGVSVAAGSGVEVGAAGTGVAVGMNGAGVAVAAGAAGACVGAGLVLPEPVEPPVDPEAAPPVEPEEPAPVEPLLAGPLVPSALPAACVFVPPSSLEIGVPAALTGVPLALSVTGARVGVRVTVPVAIAPPTPLRETAVGVRAEAVLSPSGFSLAEPPVKTNSPRRTRKMPAGTARITGRGNSRPAMKIVGAP